MIPKRLIKIGVHAGANRLQCQTHWFAGDRRKALEPQDIVLADDVRNARGEISWVVDFGAHHNKAFEFVVAMFVCVVMIVIVIIIVVIVIIVIMVVVMHLVAGLQIVLGPDALTQ